jgi:hypothetical protein
MKSCTDWWTNTKAPQNMFRPTYRKAEIDDYLRAALGVDSAILAVSLGMHVHQVESYQRELGLRKIAENNPKERRR